MRVIKVGLESPCFAGNKNVYRLLSVAKDVSVTAKEVNLWLLSV